MNSARRCRGRSGALVLATAAAFAIRCNLDQDDRDELYCENAVAQLQRCCPGFQVNPDYCRFESGTVGCNLMGMNAGEDLHPALSEGDARCVAEASCATLVDGGACARAMQATRRNSDAESRVCR